MAKRDGETNVSKKLSGSRHDSMRMTWLPPGNRVASTEQGESGKGLTEARAQARRSMSTRRITLEDTHEKQYNQLQQSENRYYCRREMRTRMKSERTEGNEDTPDEKTNPFEEPYNRKRRETVTAERNQTHTRRKTPAKTGGKEGRKGRRRGKNMLATSIRRR